MNSIETMQDFYNELLGIAKHKGMKDCVVQTTIRCGYISYWGAVYGDDDEIAQSASGESPEQVLHQIIDSFNVKPDIKIK